MKSLLRELHAPIAVECPYCGREFKMEEDNVFVLFRREGRCFLACSKCGQCFSVDDEIAKAKEEMRWK